MLNHAVDIIITTRNNAPTLRNCLVSIAAQAFSDYRCFVVDDNSSDETVSMLQKEYSWVEVLQSPKQNGPAQNRNRAIRLGAAALVAILDDDTVLDPHWLREMVSFIALSNKIGAVGSQLRFLNAPEKINSLGGAITPYGVGFDLFYGLEWEKNKDIVWHPLPLVYACSAAMLLRRQAYEDAGGFDPLYFYPGEDWDLGMRLNLVGYLVVYNPSAIAYHKLHGTVSQLPKLRNILPWRNSLFTLLKNLSFVSILRIVPRFLKWCFSLSPRLFAKIVLWNALHTGHILRWRRYLSKIKKEKEERLLWLNTHLCALAGQGGVSFAKKSWDYRLSKPLLDAYVALLNKTNTQKQRTIYVDNVIFQVTNICNAHCKHCFLRNELNKNTEQNLTLEEIKKFFFSLGRVKNVVIGGGEPFLRNDLVEIATAIDAISQPAVITIDTNGYYVDLIFSKVKAALENCKAIIKVSFSLDAPYVIHDILRGVEGLSDRLQQTYDLLAKLYHIFYPRLILQINSVIFADNYQYFFQLYGLVKERFPLAQFFFEVMRGNYDKSCVTPISLKEYMQLFQSLQERAKNGESGLEDLLRLHHLALDTLQQKRQIVPCNAGANFIVLDFFGNIYPCELLPCFANIKDIGYDFSRIAQDTRWRKIIAGIRHSQCYCTHMCFLAASVSENA
jgi:GT2 family glycosyltransferase/MoaA/NifB/PqqE/SkfB family radical SAM enzyme